MRRYHPTSRPFDATGQNRRITRAMLALALVLFASTAGFVWIEGWDVWRSLFFTLITISTVGYGDYGLSVAGERFTLFVIVGGVGVLTYSLGQIMPVLFDVRRARERAMYKQIMKLSDHIIVCGLGRIGRVVCQQLAQQEVPFVAVDAGKDAIIWAHGEGFLAAQGDATVDQVLDEVNVSTAKGLCCVTSSDSINIVITLSARNLNPDLFIISRAEHDDARRKLEQAGASRIVSPTRAGSVSIANILLKPHLVEFLNQSGGGEAEIEFAETTIAADSPLSGLTIKETGENHPDVVFVAIKNGDGRMRLRPEGGATIRGGDVLIVAGTGVSVAQFRQRANVERAAA